MTRKRLFMLNAVIAAGYGIALLVAADPILDLYGITPNPEGVYMARWFGVELLAVGLVTWLARDAAESAGGGRSPAPWRSPTASASSWRCGGRCSGRSTRWAGSRWA
jgi:hypothetical protein